MMKKIFPAIVLPLILALAVPSLGCGTKSSYQPTPYMEALNPAGGFRIDQVNDNSGYKFSGRGFDIKEAMTEAFMDELTKNGLANDGGLYAVNINILAYVPGNAFARWLLPGAGATKLYIEALILDQNYFQVAKIPVYRHIGAGGALTIGAHRYAFEDVARTLVRILKDPSKRVADKSNLTLGF